MPMNVIDYVLYAICSEIVSITINIIAVRGMGGIYLDHGDKLSGR